MKKAYLNLRQQEVPLNFSIRHQILAYKVPFQLQTLDHEWMRTSRALALSILGSVLSRLELASH